MNPSLDSTDLRWLSGLARALIGDAHAADDLVQETVVAALEGQLPVGEARRPWLRSVARRLAARRFRADDRRHRRESATARPEALPDTADLVARAEVAEQLAALTRTLPEPFRRTLLLRFLEGLSPEEIARRERKPTDTVRYRVRRGLALLREALERRDEANGSSWCVLLLPLARSGGSAGLTTAGASGALAGSVASWTLMKLTMVLVTALCGAGLWFAWQPGQNDVSGGVAQSGDTAARSPLEGAAMEVERAPDEAPLPDASASGRRPSADATPNAVAKEAPAPPGVFGRVVDDAGQPVEGATVYLVPTVKENGEDGDRTSADPDGVVAEGTSDENGAFRLNLQTGADMDQPSLDLGVAANGFLRQVLPSALGDQPTNGWLVVLAPGRRLTGRVVDGDGRGVAGLTLLAHTYAAGLNHVSPSQMLLRARRAERGDASSTYQQCRAATDAAGSVAFSGLGEGDLRVRSTDPSWTIAGPTKVRATDGDVLWTAERTIAVRLDVVDARSAAPVARASATFRFELTFADGEEIDLGQYVGRGAGSVSFAIDAENTPQITGRTVTRVVFYGTVASGIAETTWRSEPLEDTDGVRGLAEVRIALDLAQPSEVERTVVDLAPLPQAVLELDVLYEDGTPAEGTLSIDWEARPDGARRREGSSNVDSFAPGRYRLSVPAGDVELSVQERGASGSLAPWRGEVRATLGGAARAFVTLTRGATAAIQRPDGWTGEWFVRASWRPSADEDWRGSWNYSTGADALRLEALRAADWRFELRREPSTSATPRIVEATLSAGESRELSVR